MHNSISSIIAIAKRFARRLANQPIDHIHTGTKPRDWIFNHRRNRWSAALAVVVVQAAVPQCGSPPTSVTEPNPAPVTEAAESPTTEESDQTSAAAPEAVVSALLAAMQANDAEQIRSLFAVNASQAYGDRAAKSGDAFFSWLESDIIEPEGRVEDAQLEVNGNEVVVTGEYANSRGYTSAADFLITVEDGLITSWRMRY